VSREHQTAEHQQAGPDASGCTHWAVLIAQCALGLVAGMAILMYLVIAVFRLRFPFEFEFCEGGMFDCTRRLMTGLPIYAKPSIEFTSFQYTPFYYCVSALACLIFGMNLFALRLVSFVSFLGSLGLIFLFAKRETGSRLWGLAAAGLFTALFPQVDGWFDLARVDLLFLLLLLAGLYVARFHDPSIATGVAAGLVFFLAFFTKQTALLVALPVGVYFLLRNVRSGLAMFATLALTVGLSTILLDLLYDGWYTYYAFQLLGQHSRVPSLWLGFWTHDLLQPLPIAVMFAIAGVAGMLFRRREPALLYVLAAIGVLGGCWLSRVHEGSARNSVLPVYALLAILCALGGGVLSGAAARRVSRRRTCALAAVYLLCLAQFGFLRYDPWTFMPSKETIARGWRLVELVRKVRGEVLMPTNNYIAFLAGKRPWAHAASTWGLFCGTNELLKADLATQWVGAFRNGTFSVLLFLADRASYQPFLGDNYQELPVPAVGIKDLVWPRPILVHKNALENVPIIQASFSVAGVTP